MRSSILSLALLAVPALCAPAQNSYPIEKTVTVTVTHCPKTTSHSTSKSTSKSTSYSTIKTTDVITTTTSTTLTGEYPTATATATTPAKTGLNELAKQAGKVYFGTAVDIPGTAEENDKYYLQQLDNTRDFGQLTPANYMKYFATEPQRGVFNYTGGDILVDIAKKNGQLVRCHNLVWHSQLPDWLTSQTWDNATLISIMENHITNLVKHWGTSCYAVSTYTSNINYRMLTYQSGT